MKLLQACVGQVIVGPLVNVSLSLNLVVVRQSVHFMDEDLKVDVRVHLVGSGHCQVQTPQSLHVVVLLTESRLGVATLDTKRKQPHLSVNDEDQGTRSFEDHLAVEGGVEEVHLTGKVPDLEVDEGAAGNVVLVDFVGALQEQSLVGGHLVENDLDEDADESS